MLAEIVYKWKKMLCKHRRGVKSELKLIQSGVPQGSILGPMLFLLYINDLPSYLNCKTFMYADDTALLITAKSCEELQHNANHILQSVKIWMNQNKMHLNIEKTTYSIFNRSNISLENLNIKYDSTLISMNTDFKYLGIKFDKKMNFINHINHVANKLKSFLPIMYKLRYQLDEKTKLLIYKSLIESQIRFGIIIYASKLTLHKLDKLQGRILKTLFNNKNLNNILLNYNILTATNLYKYEVILKCWARLRVDADEGETNQTFDHKYNTRDRSKYRLNFNNQTHCNSLIFRQQMLYNTVPKTLRADINIKHFKTELLTYLLTKP